MTANILCSTLIESSSLVPVLFGEVFSHPYISFFHLLVNGFSVTCIIYICLWSKKKFESYFRDRLTFSNVDSRTSRRIYRLALLLRAPETLSSLSKSRTSIFNAHLTLLVRKMNFKLLSQLPFVSFLSICSILLPSQSSLYSLSTIPYFSSDHSPKIFQWHIFAFLFHTMTFFFNNAYYKFLKNKF